MFFKFSLLFLLCCWFLRLRESTNHSIHSIYWRHLDFLIRRFTLRSEKGSLSILLNCTSPNLTYVISGHILLQYGFSFKPIPILIGWERSHYSGIRCWNWSILVWKFYNCYHSSLTYWLHHIRGGSDASLEEGLSK